MCKAGGHHQALMSAREDFTTLSHTFLDPDAADLKHLPLF